MSQQIVSSLNQSRRALSFPGILAAGTMIATLLVVAYAYFASAEGAVRAHIVLQGAEVILLTLVAGFIAGAVHAIGVASESASAKRRLTHSRDTVKV
jgi:hypothetical protein